MYPTLASNMTMPHLTFPSLSRAAVRGHRATGAGAEPDPRLLPSPAHLWHHEQPTRRGRRREQSEGLCKGAGLSPVPGRAGTGGPEPLIRTPVRGSGESLAGEGRKELPPTDFGKLLMETSVTLWPCEEPNLLTSQKGQDGVEKAYIMFLGVIAEVQDTRDCLLCVLLGSNWCIKEEVGRSPLTAFWGVHHPLPHSSYPLRIV